MDDNSPDTDKISASATNETELLSSEEESANNAGAKRHKPHHSTSDRKIEDKHRIPADADCSGRTTVESISFRPSTSAGANRSYDSLELGGNSMNRNQGFPLRSAQASDMDDQSPNPRKKIASIKGVCILYSVKHDAATGREQIPAAEISPLYKGEQSRQIEKGESIPQPKRISDQTQKYFAFKPLASGRCKMVIEERKMKVLSVSDDGKKVGTGKMTIGHPASFAATICKNVKDAKITISSCVDEKATGSSNSDSSNKMFKNDRKLTLYHYCEEKASVPTTSFSATVRNSQGDREITPHSSCDENARRDSAITGPLYSCSDESARDTSTSSQSSVRTFPDENKRTLRSEGEENATETESLASLSTSVRMPQGDREITPHSSCDENTGRDNAITGPLYSCSDESARDTSTSPPTSVRMLPDENKTTLHSYSSEYNLEPVFAFSPSFIYTDGEDIILSYENETEYSTSRSASVRRPQGDQEITPPCDETVRRGEITGESSTSVDESGNISCTSAQESSHKNSLDKA